MLSSNSFGIRAHGARRQAQPVSLTRSARIVNQQRLVSLNADFYFDANGNPESDIPGIKLTRSADGQQGTATLSFTNSTLFTGETDYGNVTGLFMRDAQGVITCNNVEAIYSNGEPKEIRVTHKMRSKFEWDRFMGFMQEYAKDKGLEFAKK